MEFKTIADIYAVNKNVGDGFRRFARSISDAEANAEIDGEPWTLAALIEHVAMVEAGIAKMCARMVDGAKQKGTPSDGSYRISEGFRSALAANEGAKFEAPERVAPTGGVAIAESLESLDRSSAALAALQSDLEAYDVSELTFPHPYFGPLNAAEWVMLSGGHVSRHMAQAERLLDGVRTRLSESPVSSAK
ncbi:MAG: DinB family protein [Pyrinomonadaceae bacterium]|nr:DinB family protein [Acidobacteriota bacterium]MBK7932961.1 DinB family protein [Acidobacteriota bacterium]MBP7377695.1 DinB family protein [Pyrinomonadaceae bacterium]